MDVVLVYPVKACAKETGGAAAGGGIAALATVGKAATTQPASQTWQLRSQEEIGQKDRNSEN